jgi:hypothetical protein
MSAKVTLLPSARRLVDSLRDIGYDLPAAVADIIDNSISAGSTEISLEFNFDGTESWICITDDGIGMPYSALEEAMRYGSRPTYKPGDLGRYGLGLKTASLSQCRCLTVASRRSRERRRIEVCCWDLDHVARTNRWEVLRIEPDEMLQRLIEPLRGRPGTVVLWEGLDRILDFKYPHGAAARNSFDTLTREVRAHLEMVFHRFISGEAALGRIRILINGEELSAWDPFARSERRTVALEEQTIHFRDGGTPVLIRPYVLPTQQTFSSADAHQRAAGPAKWNRQQGLYFYRHDRLVQAGGWSRLRTVDEHTKLARVGVDIPPGREDEFGLDVAKMRVRIPGELRGAFLAIATGVASEAGAAYRSGERSPRATTGPATLEAAVSLDADPAELPPSDLSFARAVIDAIFDETHEDGAMRRRLLARIDATAVRQVLFNRHHVELAGSPAKPLSSSFSGEVHADE